MAGYGFGPFGGGLYGSGIPDVPLPDSPAPNLSSVPDQGFEFRGLYFGQSGDIVVEKFTPGVTSSRANVVPSPRADARWFGRERKTPGSWAFSLFVNEHDEISALNTLAKLKEAWDAEDLRDSPSEIAPLRYRIGNRTRRVYGRPGRCSEASFDVRRLSGYIPVEADFELADTLTYDDIERRATLTIAPASTGGLRSPLVDPLSSLMAPLNPRSGLIDVGGTAATFLTVQITGAFGARDLGVIVDDDYRIGITGPIAYDETITIDGAPWARTALSSLGGTASDRLHPSSRLERMILKPGQHQLRFDGVDPTGTATVVVAWRNASRSL